MGIPDHVTCLLRNLDAGQEATELDIEQWTGSKLGKEYNKAVHYHPYNLYADYIMQNSAGWIPSWNQDCQEKYQQPQICRWYHPYGRKWRGTKEPLDEDERGEWKTGLKLNIQKTKITAYSPITSWQIDGEKVEGVTDFIFLGSKITVDGDCSQEIKRCLLLRRKAITNLDSALKNKDTTLLMKVHIVKATVFPVVTYEYESWMTKTPEHQKSDAF